MSSQRITIRVPEALIKRLKKQAGVKSRSESALVREALERYLKDVPDPTSAYDMAKAVGLIGCANDLPPDLSTNRKYFKGFGKSR